MLSVIGKRSLQATSLVIARNRTVCLPKPSGSMRLGPAQIPLFFSASACQRIRPTMMATILLKGALLGSIVSLRYKLAVFSRMPGDYTICAVMFGSGARIGTTKDITLNHPTMTPKAQSRDRAGSSAAAAGATLPSFAGRPSATGSTPPTGSTVSGSGLSVFQVSKRPSETGHSKSGAWRRCSRSRVGPQRSRPVAGGGSSAAIAERVAKQAWKTGQKK